AMWLMLQNDEPEDFVIATGEVHSVREFVEKSFMHIGKTIVWEGKNENEVGRCKETGRVHVTVDLKYYRPTEVCHNKKFPSLKVIFVENKFDSSRSSKGFRPLNISVLLPQLTPCEIAMDILTYDDLNGHSVEVSE
ncbi:hypothetical protein STEG23_002898, partial [Scotinomys teguina]